MKLTKKQKKQIIKYGVGIIVIIVGLITGSIKKEEILNIFKNETTMRISQSQDAMELSARTIDLSDFNLNLSVTTQKAVEKIQEQRA